MGDDVVIRAEALGKKYSIGHQATERVPTLRDAISRTAANLARTTRDLLRGEALIAGDEVEEFWALKDVNFEIQRGEVVGIIGRNGAGKSTLLKILSRITEPSEGRVEIKGRVASLLEVGTGFHPELTGRENIYLNGAILGMTRAEIRRKFHEIVAFAEIEKFLDTPVKRYSSGMYVRLAFAVAAHLEPEILIVDEVLAVGDAEFQKKCLGKMQAVAGEGRTVLFVSHNLSTIAALCDRTIYLSQGRIEGDGSTSETIKTYTRSNHNNKLQRKTSIGSGDFRLTVQHVAAKSSHCGGIIFEISCELDSPLQVGGALNLFLKDEAARPVGATSIGGMGCTNPLQILAGGNKIGFELEVPRLAAGNYFLDIELAGRGKERLAFFEEAIELESSPAIEKDCSEVLSQSWGFGNLWIKGDRV